MDQAAHKSAMERLQPFIGEWSLDASFPGAPSTGPLGWSVFAWALGGQYLIERSEVSHPDAPDGLCVIGFDLETKKYVQHYFDSRGVARIYAMTFNAGNWELLRAAADFTPLDFYQR